METQSNTKSKHKPQAMFLAPCHMLHSLPTNKPIMMQGICKDSRRHDIQKTLMSFKREKKGRFIISVHSTLWIMQDTPTSKE
jgi:hypothetical protein